MYLTLTSVISILVESNVQNNVNQLLVHLQFSYILIEIPDYSWSSNHKK